MARRQLLRNRYSTTQGDGLRRVRAGDGDVPGVGLLPIVGTVGPDGEPHAARGWGITVPTTPSTTVRLLVDADDADGLRHLADGGAVAVTGADVPTLRSVQLKGRSLGRRAGHRRRSACGRGGSATTSSTTSTRPTAPSGALLERLVPASLRGVRGRRRRRLRPDPRPRCRRPAAARCPMTAEAGPDERSRWRTSTSASRASCPR